LEERRNLRNSRCPIEQGHPNEYEGEESNLYNSSSEEGGARRPHRPRKRSHLDFKVDIPEFEGQLDPVHRIN